MTFPPKLRTTLVALAIVGAFGAGTANAADSSLYDLQPCPDSLAVKGGAEPSKKWDLYGVKSRL
jgi:hypothetical protein